MSVVLCEMFVYVYWRSLRWWGTIRKPFLCSKDQVSGSTRREAHHDWSMLIFVTEEDAVSRRNVRVHNVNFQLILAKTKNSLTCRFLHGRSSRLDFMLCRFYCGYRLHSYQ